MSETSQLKSSGSLNPITGASFNILSIPGASPINSRKNSMNSFPVDQKIIEEVNNEDNIDVATANNSALAQEYFKEDPNNESEEDENSLRRRYQNGMLTNSYESYFKPGVFFKFLLMHALFFGLLGPFIVILTPIFGWKLLMNQGFVGLNIDNLRQSAEFMIIISFMVVFYVEDVVGMQAIEMYMLLVTMLIRIIMIASKYSYQTRCFLKLFHTTILNKTDRRNDQILGRWRIQNDEIIQEEIQAAIMRLEIDSPLFFFNFLGETSPELKAKLSKSSKLGIIPPLLKKNEEGAEEEAMPCMQKIRKENKSNQNFTLGNSPNEAPEQPRCVYTPKERANMAKEDKSMSIGSSRSLLPATTIAVFRAFSHFFEHQKLESKLLYGYNLAFDLIKHARKVRYHNLGKKTLALSVFRALIPTLYRVYMITYKKEDIPLFTDKPYIVSVIFVLNVFYYWANTFILAQSIQAFKAKIWCFKQVGYLISPKKIHYFKERKLYPTLNIFDPITLKTWSNLRKIMREYGNKYFLRNNLNITIAMVFYIFVFCTLILQLLGVFTAYSDPLMFIVFGFETIIYFIIFFSVMTGAAFLNNQFKVHKNLLKKNKTIIADFQRLSHLYVGKDAIKPDNIIYKEGLKILKDELGETDFQQKLVARAEKLTGMIDDIIEELEFEEINEPFTVMGVAVDYGLLKSAMLGGVSLAFAVGQSLANA